MTVPRPDPSTPIRSEGAGHTLTAELARLRATLEQFVLPFWSTEGFDARHGLFHERFDFAACPDADAPRRAMVQARQIYVFSGAALRGVLPLGADLVERGVETLIRRFESDDGGFAFSVAADGTVRSGIRDSYTHAFVLFALAWAFRLNGDPRIRRAVDRTLAFMDRSLVDPIEGGLYDQYPQPSPQKAQNPQMHLFEALLALHEALPDGPYLERASAMAMLFRAKILRREPWRVPERFGSDWSTLADPEYAFFEPGHHYEWIWLLDWYDRLSGNGQSDLGRHLWRVAVDHGTAENGRVVDEVGFDLQPRKLTHRLWPHAESLKAAAVRFAAGDPDAVEVAARMGRALNGTFLGRPFAGGWVDRVAPDGTALVDTVPASSLYHLYCAWVEAERIFVRSEPRPDRAGPLDPGGSGLG